VLGGALGALARYGLDGLIERRTFSVFPWSTLVSNVSGCLRFGSASSSVSSAAYTTFSTFAQETVDLAKTHDYALALTNAVASLTIGVVAVLAGTAVGKAIG
jgi:CrcB protein